MGAKTKTDKNPKKNTVEILAPNTDPFCRPLNILK